MIWSLELDEMRMRIEMEVKCQLNNIMGKTLQTVHINHKKPGDDHGVDLTNL